MILEQSIPRYLEVVSKNAVPNTLQYIPQNIDNNSFLFSFRYLEEYGEFQFKSPSKHKNGASLVSVVETLIKYSQHTPLSINGESHCHDVGEDRLKTNKLEAFVTKFKSKRFFQFGVDGKKERVIGFFNNENANLFEVILFDLDHKIFPVAPRRVFAS